jgi:hypothetical protein
MIRAFRLVGIAAFPVALMMLTGCPKPSTDSSAPASSSAATTGSAANSGGTTSAGGTIKFTKQDPQVGSSFSQAEALDLKFEITKPDKQSFEESSSTKKQVTILATSGKAITKVKVKYSSASSKTKKDGIDKTNTAQVTGNTYVVESVAGSVNVTDENHKPVSAAESETVAGDFGELGKPDAVLSQLPDVPLKVGDKADTIADALRASLASNGELKSSSVTLKDITSDGNGVFDVKVSFSQSRGALKMNFDLDGTMTVRSSDSRLVSFDLKGPITFGGDVTGKGTFTSTDSRTY